MPGTNVPINVQIGDDVLEAPFDAQVLAVGPGKDPGRSDVHDDT